MNHLFGLILKCSALVIFQTIPRLKLDYFKLKTSVSDNISKNFENKIVLIEALVTIEDRRFYFHKGVDFASVIRAFIRNSYADRLEGASTITQQLVRVVTDKREITLRRKIKEMMLAALIERDYSKDEIINAYMNSYRFIEIIGIEEFCQNEKYDFDDLTISNSIEIAARFKYPCISPRNYIRYLKRVRTIEKKLSPTLCISNSGVSAKTKHITINQNSVLSDSLVG
jgi:hypothetical protein